MSRKPFALAALMFGALAGLGAGSARGAGAVTVRDEGGEYVLSNDIVTARISKRTGGMVSLVYRGIETLNRGNPGNWSHTAATKDDKTTAKITIDPASNGGERAEVSVKGISGGTAMGSGPGGSAVADIEIRFAIERETPGVYTYSIWTHPASYPATNVGEARFYVKLNDDVFDWMTVDANRNMKLLSAHDWNYGTPLNMKEVRRINTGELKGQVEHKYDYSANQFDVLAWGWSSTTKNVGLWFVNPTIEYLSGGPTKVELSAHRDATFNPEAKDAPAPPCLLNYWRGSHYGGSVLQVNQGEEWSKVIGPFLVYCNSGPTPDAMWKDALARSKVESAAWPFEWAGAGVDYPHRDQRATVTGQVVLKDPLSKMSKLMVGLTAPDWGGRAGRGGAGNAGKGGEVGTEEQRVGWQNDAKHYQFWVRGNDDGTFSIPNVRPGKYTLHAYATGVFGELVKADVTVQAGKPLDVGMIDWAPERLGKQVWEIGVPDRSAGEFLHGNEYWHWGWYLKYPQDFPHDVNFTIGKSDFRKDWNYAELPRATDDIAKAPGGPTTWTVNFELAEAPKSGKGILRMGICGTGNTTLTVGVNGSPAGDPLRFRYNSVINRDSVVGLYTTREVTFDATLLKQGENKLTLSIPGGPVTDGIEYDYLRLELAE